MKRFVLRMVGLALLWGVAGQAKGDPINPGFDLFATDPTGTSANLGVPFGLLQFGGVPLDPVNLGNTDTIVQRTGSLPAGGTGPIPIELVALELKSAFPVNVGGTFFDVYAIINKNNLIPGLPQPDVLPPSTGSLTVLTHNDPNGGTFNSFFDVFVDIELTNIGVDPKTGPIVAHMASGNEGPFQATGSWSHTARAGYPTNPSFPSGSFFPVGHIVETGPMAMHSVDPAVNGLSGVPEPASLTLLSIALTGLAGYVMRRRNKVRAIA